MKKLFNNAVNKIYEREENIPAIIITLVIAACIFIEVFCV